MKYFYIIQRDGQITEIEYNQERFSSAFNQWQKGGLIIFTNLGIGLNSVDISKILNEEQYENYISSAQPRFYIKNGAWYDNKDKTKPVRYEKWRELEIEEKRKLLTTTQKIADGEQIREWIKNNKPSFLKEIETIKNNIKI